MARRSPSSPGSASALAAVACITAWLLPPTASAQEPPEPSVPAPTQNALAGSSIFGAKGCVDCHSVRGRGGTVGPDLGRAADERSFYGLAAAMWNHLPAMADTMARRGVEPPRLQPREAGNLVAFLYAVDYFGTRGDPARGERLFRDMGCVRCHQVGGVGGAVGPDLDFLGRYSSPIQVAAAMWSHGPAMATEFRQRGIERPRFEGEELSDVIAYLESTSPGIPSGPISVLPGRPNRGRSLFRTRNCIECHSVGGRGGDVGPDLGRKARGRSPVEFAAAMWNHQPKMMEAAEERGMSLPELSPTEMADLVAYLYSVRYFREAGSPAAGRRVVRERGCLACHSLGGGAGPRAGDLEASDAATAEAVVAALWNHAAATSDTLLGAVRWPRLTASEVADVTAFLLDASETP